MTRRRLRPFLSSIGWLAFIPGWLLADPSAAGSSFTRQVLSDTYYCDGINAGDFNRDGVTDIIVGPFWYEGPDYRGRHEVFPAQPQDAVKGQSNSMFSYVHDFNRDGWPDILVLGRIHLHQAFWYENPRGRPGPWQKHFVFERVRGESPPFVDIDGDGKPELIAHHEGRWGRIAPDWDHPAEPWGFRPITAPGDYPQFYHGTGVGDVNGDGRLDLILNEGWWEQPPSGSTQTDWVAHPFRFGERGGAQMLVDDVDEDGDNDIITSLDAHGWGLAWFEQVREAGAITFWKHMIMGDRSEERRYGVAFSQPHALDLADIDGDGRKDIVTGKRRWAHGPKGDVEPEATPVVYWFQRVRGPDGAIAYKPHLIDDESGVGVQIIARDLDGDGATDVLSASKLGSFVFRNTSRPKESLRGKSDTSGRFLRLWWYEPGLEHGNPAPNRRFRVNAPEVGLHPVHSTRQEVKGNGMMLIAIEEALTQLAGAELALELWGGHPGTANRRVTINGRSTYALPNPPGAHCSHAYPVIPLKLTDLVPGYNAIQFACDQGTTFWGHMIVDNACLRAELKRDHPDLAKAGLSDFSATVHAQAASDRPETFEVSLACDADDLKSIAFVDFEARYEGYDENGDGKTDDWHGFTKNRLPVAHLGRVTEAPFTTSWDVSMLPAQRDMAIRAVVHLRDAPGLIHITAPTTGLAMPVRSDVDVRIRHVDELPAPFWSRAGKLKTCTIDLDVEPAQIDRAELHVVAWDGGKGTIENPFTINEHPLSIVAGGKHDVLYSRLKLDPGWLKRGANRLELLSDTEHHGIEILLPGPALVVRSRR